MLLITILLKKVFDYAVLLHNSILYIMPNEVPSILPQTPYVIDATQKTVPVDGHERPWTRKYAMSTPQVKKTQKKLCYAYATGKEVALVMLDIGPETMSCLRHRLRRRQKLSYAYATGKDIALVMLDMTHRVLVVFVRVLRDPETERNEQAHEPPCGDSLQWMLALDCPCHHFQALVRDWQIKHPCHIAFRYR
jgi:hypothetical protein